MTNHLGGVRVYTNRQIRRVIKHYQELRSAVTTSASGIKDENCRRSSLYEAADTVCMLVDLEQALSILTMRQRMVVLLISLGYGPEFISSRLNISRVTVKFHLDAAILRIMGYLNAT